MSSLTTDKCKPRHILNDKFKCIDCGKTSQEIHDSFELSKFACGCSEIYLSPTAKTTIQCEEHAEESMWEMS
jgi:DNA-directed RNA polymerase subunit RPC12/RpoP